MKNNLDTFSERLTHALEVRGFTQSGLAKRLGIKRQAIQYICSHGEARSKHGFHMAVALGVDPYWLILGAGEMPPCEFCSKQTRLTTPDARVGK